MFTKKLVSIVIVLILFTSCGSKPIKIGFSANLTGTGSEFGTNAMYGAYIAVDSINEKGGIHGKQVKLIVKNDGNDINTALEVDKQLIDEGVVGIIGHLLSNTGQLSIPYINEKKMIMISPTISSDTYSNQDDYFLSLIPPNSNQAKKISTVLKEHNKLNIGLLYQKGNIIYSKSLADSIISDYQDSKHNVVFNEPFLLSDSLDFQYKLDLIVNSPIDALIIVGSGYDVANFTQALSSDDFSLPIYSSVWAMTNDLLSIGGSTANGIYLVSYFDEHSTSEDYLSFHKSYVDKYGSEPTFSSILAYEATHVLIQALVVSNSTNSTILRDTILAETPHNGLQGLINFDENGDVLRDISLFQIVDEHYIKVVPNEK